MKQVVLTITASVAVVAFGYVALIGLIIATKGSLWIENTENKRFKSKCLS